MITTAKNRADSLPCPDYQTLEVIWNSMGIGVFTVDLDRRITSFNAAAEAITGYSRDAVTGLACHEVFGNNLCQGDCRFHRAFQEGKPYLNYDLEIEDHEGNPRVINKTVSPLKDKRGRLIGAVESFQDVSLFWDLHSKMRDQSARFRQVLDSMALGVVTLTRSGHILSFNAGAEKMTGYRRESTIGKLCREIFQCNLCRGDCPLERILQTKQPISELDGEIKSRKGTAVPIRISFTLFQDDELKTQGAVAIFEDRSLIHHLEKKIHQQFTCGDIISRDPKMKTLFDLVPLVAERDVTVLIQGPTGTGKDLLAKVIHEKSRRHQGPFIKVNCAAIPEALLESEMFGYVRGAFTGALQDKPGLFQLADQGTIFLDEIGDLPLSLQAKLLRVLEDKEFYPLGAKKTVKADVRILAATNQNLEKMIQERSFREDLYYRLNVIRLELPPLKDRMKDLPLLIEHFLEKNNLEKEKRIQGFDETALALLFHYEYPGNIRELENIIEHSCLLCRGEVIHVEHLPLFLRNFSPDRKELAAQEDQVFSFEKKQILEALKAHSWNRQETAKQLRMNRSTLWRKMKYYDLRP
ncbi:MAG TPA: sigma 54-interacting transcriptional regulator [Thermodesulfobacteriota bacterium]|nr:sigma 54-interacting transcriptional regulator [Thermodesulfobacteriota bacterium]